MGGNCVITTKATLAVLMSTALMALPVFASNVHRSPTSEQSSGTHKSLKSKRRSRVRGQQAIEPERVTQIQQALIREHYFTGDADGKWDATTVAAMQKYQADHGWQTKLMPDSRALVKLGLGADYSNAINAKDANFSSPAPASGLAPSQTAGFVEASGVHQ
jgi:peptidoglycan hydrolase-like protein with peptidoglycan-binding domain